MVGLAGWLLSATAGADVHATIGRNSVPMPEKATSYRLARDGDTASRSSPLAPPASLRSPNGRYRVEFDASRLVVIDRLGGRRTLRALDPVGAPYWSSQGDLAFTTRESGTERLVVSTPRPEYGGRLRIGLGPLVAGRRAPRDRGVPWGGRAASWP